jgi:predicted RNA-binding Zn ribbon-like protein
MYSLVKRELDIKADTSVFLWRYPEIETTPLGFLEPVIQSAADLLISGNLDRLKRCSNPMCGWLYYDTSKNNSRRWCCMKTCGNRAKANKFYQTHK